MKSQTWVEKKCDVLMRAKSARNSRCHCYGDPKLGEKKCDVFTRANSVRNSRCHFYGDPKLGGKKM